MENPSGNLKNNSPRAGYFKRYPPLRVILACVLGLFAGWMQPEMFMMSFMFCLMPVILSVLYAWAGWIPAAVASAAALTSMVQFAPAFSVSPALMAAGTLLVSVFPAAVVIYTMEKQMKFFHRLAFGAAAQMGALLVCMLVIYLGLKVDLADALTGGIRETLNMLPAGSVTLFLEQLNMYGMLTEESIAELEGGIVTAADVSMVLDQAMDTMNYYFKQVITALVLSSGLLSGLAAVSLSSRIRRDCRTQPLVDHVMLDYWRVPPRFAGMALLGVVTGYVMQMMSMNGSESVTVIFVILLSEMLTIQGAAAISRRFRDVGAGVIARIGLIAASLVLMPSFLEMVGVFSLLMGSEGVITKWMKKRIEQRESEDDEE